MEFCGYLWIFMDMCGMFNLEDWNGTNRNVTPSKKNARMEVVTPMLMERKWREDMVTLRWNPFF